MPDLGKPMKKRGREKLSKIKKSWWAYQSEEYRQEWLRKIQRRWNG